MKALLLALVLDAGCLYYGGSDPGPSPTTFGVRIECHSSYTCDGVTRDWTDSLCTQSADTSLVIVRDFCEEIGATCPGLWACAVRCDAPTKDICTI